MSKTELKLQPEMVFDDLTRAMEKLSEGRITVSEANKIAKRASELRKNNFIIKLSDKTTNE